MNQLGDAFLYRQIKPLTETLVIGLSVIFIHLKILLNEKNSHAIILVTSGYAVSVLYKK